MDILKTIENKIEELKKIISDSEESNKKEKSIIQEQIRLLEECESVSNDEEKMIGFDFSKVLNLIEQFGYDNKTILKTIEDIKNVLSIRKQLKMSEEELPLDEKQIFEYKKLINKLKEVKEDLNKKLNQLPDVEDIKKKISDLEGLLKVFQGGFRRKYYTIEMFNTFCEVFDIFHLPPEQAHELLGLFYNTSNLKIRQNVDEVNIEEVISLFAEFFVDTSFKLYEKLIRDHKNEVSSKIDLDNAREILQFFKDKNILDKFKRTALLKITIYGKAEYIKETVYPEIMADPSKDIFFEDDLASVWIKEKGKSNYRTSTFRRNGGRKKGQETELLSPSSYTVDYDEFRQNVELLRENSNLFGDKFNLDDPGANIAIKTLPVWVLKKNIELCKLFGLGSISSLPATCVINGNLEDKIHLAIELGLLNPPLNSRFRMIDKDIVRSEQFQTNYNRKKIYNQSIRNYFQRYLGMLGITTINEYAYMFYILKEHGYIEFYNEFFSEAHAGKANRAFIEQVKEIATDKDKIDGLVSNNFLIDYYSNYIDNYGEYDEILNEYNDEDKTSEYNGENYFSRDILEDPLIKELESNNTVIDFVTQNDEEVERMNEFVYMFDDRIISRYKVLHNASILKSMYGYLSRDMVLTSIVRNSFLDSDSFQKIYSSVMKGSITL